MNKIKEINIIFLKRMYIQCNSKNIRIIEKFWFDNPCFFGCYAIIII